MVLWVVVAVCHAGTLIIVSFSLHHVQGIFDVTNGISKRTQWHGGVVIGSSCALCVNFDLMQRNGVT